MLALPTYARHVLGRSTTEIVVNAVAVTVIGVGLILGWRSGSEVVRGNRLWTRVWWMSLSGLLLVIGGYVLPIGATYVVVQCLRRGRSSNRTRRVRVSGYQGRVAGAPDVTPASE
jgi:hypothetical protein